MKNFIPIDLWCFQIIPNIDNAVDFHNIVVACKQLYQQTVQSKCSHHREWINFQQHVQDSEQCRIIPTNISNFFRQKQIQLALKSVQCGECNAAQAIARFLCDFNKQDNNNENLSFYKLYPQLDFSFQFFDQEVPLKVAIISEHSLNTICDKIMLTKTSVVELGIPKAILQQLDKHIAESLLESINLTNVELDSQTQNNLQIIQTDRQRRSKRQVWGIGEKYRLLLKSVETGNILAVALCLDQLQFEIDYKALREHLDSFSIFFDSSRTFFPEFNFDTELHVAIEHCKNETDTMDIIQYFLKYGNSDLIHVTDRHGHSPLVKAIIHDKLTVVKYLLENFEIDVNKVYYHTYGSIIFTNDDSYFVHQCSALMIALSL